MHSFEAGRAQLYALEEERRPAHNSDDAEIESELEIHVFELMLRSHTLHDCVDSIMRCCGF